MPQPPIYERQYDFSDFQDSFPDRPLPGDQVDIELNSVQTSVNALVQNLGLLQSDDGDLNNAIVTIEKLSSDLLLLIAGAGLNFRGMWLALTQYAIGDVVRYATGATYVAIEAHTSTNSFQDDLDSELWMLLANPVGALGDIVFARYNGNAVTTAFTLPIAVSDEKQLFVFVNGAALDPLSDYTVSGTTITFASAPPVGTNNILVFGVDQTAVTSANVAVTAANAAQNSATTASTQAGIATGAASTATGAASTATTQANNASNSASSAAAVLSDFEKLYLGAYASDPTLDNEGNPLTTGALYFSTASNVMRAYNGATWQNVPVGITQLTGDVTASGSGSVAATIANDSVPTAKLGGDIGSDSKTFLQQATAALKRGVLGAAALTSNTFSGAQRGTPVSLTQAATIAVDFALANMFYTTMTGNRTLGAPSNVAAGQSGQIEIIQDATGGRTLAFNSAWLFAGGVDPILSTGANAKDILFYTVGNGGVVYASLQKGFA